MQVLHGHEWGGAFVDVIISSHFRQLQPGFRVIVEPHGGHVWCSPTDVAGMGFLRLQG